MEVNDGPRTTTHQPRRKNMAGQSPRKKNKHVDVVHIVRKVRTQLEHQSAQLQAAGQLREKIRDNLRSQMQRMNFPSDVIDDLLGQHLEWVLDPDIFWISKRPVIGPILNFFRKIIRPIIKLFFNPDALLHSINRLSYLVVFQQKLIEDLLVENELRKMDDSQRRPQNGIRNNPRKHPSRASYRTRQRRSKKRTS